MKKRDLILFFLVLSLGCGLPGGKDAPTDAADVAETIFSELLASRVLAAEVGKTVGVDERMAHLRVPGFAMAVIENDRITWTGGHGHFEFGPSSPVTAETAFQAASMSKAVAAFGALVMVERGLLDLDTPVNEYLSDWQIPADDRDQAGRITMAHLLGHTAALTVHGFPGYAPGQTLPTNEHVLDGAEPANTDPVRIEGTVGEAFRYSGGGYTVAEQVMEEVSGRGFADLMQELVLDPLGMNQSSFVQPADEDVAGRAAPAIDGLGGRHEDIWHVYPEQAAAGLWTTPGDYARFVLGVAAALQEMDGALISKQLAERMITPVEGDYGLGVAVKRDGDSVTISHGGSNYGYKCSFNYSPDRKSGFVVMTSADNGSTLVSEILRSAKRHFGWGEFDQEVIDVVPLPEDWEALAGSWHIEEFDYTFSIFIEDGELWIEDEHTAAWQLHHIGGDVYRAMEEPAVISAHRTDQGEVESLTLDLGSRNVTAKRVEH